MINLVRLPPVSGLPIKAYFNLGWYAKVLLVEILGAYVKGCDFGKRRWRSETALFDVFDFIVRDQMLRNTLDGERKCLGMDGLKNADYPKEENEYLFNHTTRFELV